MLELIKKYYKMGIYNDRDIDVYVRSGDITAEQAQKIKESKAQVI